MGVKTRSRRAFLAESSAGFGAAWIATNYPAILEAQKSAQAGGLTFFNAEQMREVEAIVAQIIPADETPGAKEAHCQYFIDRALSGFAKAISPPIHRDWRICRPQTGRCFRVRHGFPR